MTNIRTFLIVALLATPVLIGGPELAAAQEVDIVAVDVKKVGQGYRVSELMGDEVVNDVGEEIGEIDDFLVTRDDYKVFTVLEVGEFLGLGGHLIAVPLESLRLAA